MFAQGVGVPKTRRVLRVRLNRFGVVEGRKKKRESVRERGVRQLNPNARLGVGLGPALVGPGFTNTNVYVVEQLC